MDEISIRRLAVSCIIGCNPPERTHEHTVYVSASLACDCSKAGHSDDLNDTINYHALAMSLRDIALKGKYHLIEAMAEAMAADCLRHEGVVSVRITVEKPSAIEDAECAAVTIERRR